MRLPVAVLLLLAPGVGLAFAQVVPARPAPPTAREAVAAQKAAHETAVADCVQMWDRGTHMTKQEWSRTCRRVQDRLQQLQLK